MNNSVMISSIKPRIEYYTKEIGINSNVEKNEYKKQIENIGENATHAQILFVKRSLEAFDLAMGEKMTTTKMYLQGDINYFKKLENEKYPSDKTSGRNFVEVMKQNENNENVNDESGLNMNKTLTKVNSNSDAYKLYNNVA